MSDLWLPARPSRRDVMTAAARLGLGAAAAATFPAPLAAQGLATIRARHTCAHRVDELLAILRRLGADEDEWVTA